MDPERQWIARLESETPVEPAPELIDESPLGRVSRATAGGAVAVFGALVRGRACLEGLELG